MTAQILDGRERFRQAEQRARDIRNRRLELVNEQRNRRKSIDLMRPWNDPDDVA